MTDDEQKIFRSVKILAICLGLATVFALIVLFYVVRGYGSNNQIAAGDQRSHSSMSDSSTTDPTAQSDTIRKHHP